MAELALRALVYLLPSELGGRKGPLRRGDYRPSWNLGQNWLGQPTLNDGRVLLDEVAQLAPGNAAQARIEPLFPEYWGRVGVGSVLPMQEGPHVVGNATILEVLEKAEHLRPEICDFVDQARRYCDFVQRAASFALFERLQGARVRLLELYAAGMRLPEVEPPDEEWTSPSAPEPQVGFESFDRYAEVFDPYVLDDRNPVEGSLSDDLLDVYRDVQSGLLLWDRGGPKAGAVWEWRFRFRTHWGKHAADALRALHHACSNPVDPGESR